MRSSVKHTLLAFCCVVLLPAVALAKKNNPNLALRFTPTTAVAEANSVPASAMRDASVGVIVSDDRGGDGSIIGSRTDDDDRRFDLKATNDLAGHIEAAFEKQARDWGYSVASGPADADIVLVAKTTQFGVDETNQAVGASYEAQVTLEVELRDRSGKSLWSSSVFGDASRYGKKFSADNANEVLSDALAEAFAEALNDSALRDAWIGKAGTSSSGDATAAKATAPMTPEKALSEVKSLMDNDMDEATVVDYLRARRLTRALGADDLGAWKEAGVPESVIRVAMTMPVG
ncbi:MAG: YajG family lipoprotein [Acidobacteriota bacterium]